MLPHHLDRFAIAVGPPFLRTDNVGYSVVEHVAELIDGHDFAAALETRIDRQHTRVAHRRLQQQITQVSGKDFYGVHFGPIGQLAADLSFETRQDQASKCVTSASTEELGVRVIDRNN
jgi:hypothetical protein